MTPDPIEIPEAKKTGHRWLDMLVALSALAISAVSIFVAQDTSVMMEKLVHANSWPFLQLGSGNATDDGQAQLAFYVENVGTGPARIHTFQIEVDGAPVRTDYNYLYATIEACCAEEFAAATQRAGGNPQAAVGNDLTSTVSSRFLAPNAEIGAARWIRTEQNEVLWRAVDQARQTGRIVMTSCYCSVFDECWIASSHSFPPESVERCEEPPAQSRPARAN